MFTVAGTLLGGMEKTFPREAKHRLAKINAKAKMTALNMVTPKASPIMMGTSEITVPKANETRTSPIIIVSSLTGQDIRRSSVLACASHGTTTGETEVAVKKRIMPTKPDIMKSTDMCLPIMKARNKKTGKRTPKIITGPFK
jgi:hypothetical protein